MKSKLNSLFTGLVSTAAVSLLLATGCGKESAPPAEPPTPPTAPVAPAPREVPVVEAPATPADQAWQQFVDATRPPRPPAEWQTQEPSPEEIAKFREQNAEVAAQAADRAKQFYTEFAEDPRAREAKGQEFELLSLAVQLGNTNRLEQLERLEQERLKDPETSEEERFALRVRSAQRQAMSRQSEGMAAVLEEFEKSVRELQKEFPQRPETFDFLVVIASNAEPERAKKLIAEVLDSPASDEAKEEAREMLKKLELVGQPLEMKFAAVDGREVDVQNMKGKVVLVDFWATWCAPCMEELPTVKAVYEKLNPKGFEIIGISLDQSKPALVKVVEQEKMAWPQYFETEGEENRLAKKFGITAIPAMWLVDKKGVLRELNARDNLEEKVAKLLAE